MKARGAVAILLSAVAVLAQGGSDRAGSDRNGPDRNGPEVHAALDALGSAEREPDDAADRRRLFRSVLAVEAALPDLEGVVDRRLDALEREYAEILDEPIRAVYRQRLRGLSTAELREVAKVRRVWRNYILRPSTQLHFQQHFLVPATKVVGLLLPDVAAIETKASKAQMRRMLEWNGYRDEVRAALGLDADPTTGKQAPTGIPLPPLSRVRSYDEHLDHLHRTMAVASSVAPRTARAVLLDNANKARLIDYEEAEFVLYANEIRALTGVICWSTDVLACAATRDHSKDRVDGNAKGHFSSLPGKRGFTDRLRRFGTSGSSEGAGGGANGRSYLHALSYGGGHTGPLYSMKRNKVGVGRYGDCYTSTYARDAAAVHPCQASTGELFMPPGIELDEIEDPSLQDVYHALMFENYVGARQLVKQAKAKTRMDRFVRDWFAVVIEVEADWRLECIARVAAAGDLHAAEQMIARARGCFGDSLDKRLRDHDKRMATRSGSAILAAGRAYAAACVAGDFAVIEAVARDHPDTVYAAAARHFLAALREGKEAHPKGWFLGADRYLARFEYLTPD